MCLSLIFIYGFLQVFLLNWYLMYYLFLIHWIFFLVAQIQNTFLQHVIFEMHFSQPKIGRKVLEDQSRIQWPYSQKWFNKYLLSMFVSVKLPPLPTKKNEIKKHDGILSREKPSNFCPAATCQLPGKIFWTPMEQKSPWWFRHLA